MSEVSESATISLHLADFASVDPQSKVNAVGMSIDAVGFDPAQGVTTRFTVVGEILVPSRLCPVEASIELVLMDATGAIVELPGPAGPQKLRIGQPVRLESPNSILQPWGRLPTSIPARYSLVIDFGNGLPLTPGSEYVWRLRVDGDDGNGRDRALYVPGPPTAPVIG